MMRILKFGVLLLVAAGSRSAAADRDVVDSASLTGKVLAGYQGWFACPGDGSGAGGWHHWFRGGGELAVEMWPDVSGFGDDELFNSGLKLPDGSPARLFSSSNGKTVARHFQWMKEADIDGIFLQRFIGEVQDPRFFKLRNRVTSEVMDSAAASGRVFALEYDMAAAQADEVVKDWKFLVDEMKLTEFPRYLRHKGKPVLALWGVGFTHRKGTAEQAQALVDWFRRDAPERYRATIIGGVPTGWRTGGGDSQPGEAWAKVYRSMDVISPWTVGRFKDDAGADAFRRDFLEPDLVETKRLGMEYLPVVWPGFSWNNLHDGPKDEIPRRGGRFFWRQVFNAASSGAGMLKVAMFDEVDEATAIFKTAPSRASAPANVWTLTLDSGGQLLPSNWYLRLAGESSRLIRKEIPLSAELPIRP
jgi:hypothetical protein